MAVQNPPHSPNCDQITNYPFLSCSINFSHLFSLPQFLDSLVLSYLSLHMFFPPHHCHEKARCFQNLIMEYRSDVVCLPILASCSIMHHNAPSCTIMHHHAPSCTIMHHHAPSCTIMHHHAPSCTIMHHHAPSCTIKTTSRHSASLSSSSLLMFQSWSSCRASETTLSSFIITTYSYTNIA